MSSRNLIYLIFLTCLAAACTVPASSTPAPLLGLAMLPDETPSPNYQLKSSGGGDPRPAAYWVLWNTCAPENRSTQAAANGGRETGWLLMDDLLTDPGMLIGQLQVETCQQAVSLLQSKGLKNIDMSNDAAYTLTVQLLAAQLNLALGAESCSAAEDAVQAGQLLLISLGFDGTGLYLGPPVAKQDRDTALTLAAQLNQYNNGSLCIP